jgi:arsenate reductase (thioredoxin)
MATVTDSVSLHGAPVRVAGKPAGLKVSARCARGWRGATDRVFNVLFRCTGNSARAIMAEAILQRLGAGRLRAYSAGSRPKGHPEAIRLLGSLGFDTANFRSKSWDAFARPGAPLLDFVFTVCDNPAGEACPV